VLSEEFPTAPIPTAPIPTAKVVIGLGGSWPLLTLAGKIVKVRGRKAGDKLRIRNINIVMVREVYINNDALVHPLHTLCHVRVWGREKNS